MAVRVMKASAWEKASAQAYGKPSWWKLNGPSPGGVAAELGMTRQGVHKAIHRGDLDAIIVKDDRTDRMRLFMVLQPSVDAFKARREQRQAG